MAQFQDEKSSEPLKITHGEREESQQQAWPRPSAPAFLTKATQGTDDQSHDKNENEVNQPHKKSMLQKVKDRAKTFIQKHSHGHGDDHREDEDQHQFEEEEDHDHLEQEEKEDKEGQKKEKAEDLNTNFNSRSSDAGSAVSPGLEALSPRNLSNDSEAARDQEVTNTGIQDPNVVAASFEPRAAVDRPPSPVESERGQQELSKAPADTESAVSPGLDSSSTRNLSNDSDAARDREVTNTGIQWTSRDPEVVAQSFEPRAASDRPPSPVERGQQELPKAPDQPSAVITPILQSKEGAGNTARPYEDAQSDSYSNKYMAHDQVDDIGGTDTAVSTTRVPAIHPVQSEFSQELPSSVPYNRGKEAPENELYGNDEPEKIDYSEPFDRVPRVPEGMMKPAITEERAVETVPIQQAAEDRWFDADNSGARAPTVVKDQNPSPRYPGSEEFGTTEPISDELEYAEQDKVEGKEIKRHAELSDESQDLKTQEASSEDYNENAGRSAAYSVEGSKDTTAMDLGAGTGLHANEKEKERKDEETAELDESYMEKNNVMTSTSTEKNSNVASKLGNDEQQSVDEAPYEAPGRMQAEEDNDRNSEKGKSYGDKFYETDSTEKNEIPSKLEYGEHQEPEQKEGEKRTERPSADDEEGAHEVSGIDTPSAAESVVSPNQAVEKKAERQTGDDDEVEEKTKPDGHDSGAVKSYSEKMYESANTAKSALYSRFGFGAAKTVKDEPAEIKE